MPKKFATDIAEPLISAIQKRECLYNTRDPGYRNRNVSELAWKAVADEIHRDVSFCKATWASLRCTFNRNVAGVRKKSGGSSTHMKPKWQFYQQMLFLKDHVSHGQIQMTGNLEPPDDSYGDGSNASDDSIGSIGSIGSSEDQVLEFGDGDSQFTLDTVDTQLPTGSLVLELEEAGPSSPTPSAASTAPTPRPSSTATAVKRKITEEDPVQHVTLDCTGPKRRRPDEDDEDLIILRGLLPFFKNLTPAKKLLFMHHSTGLLMDLNADTDTDMQ